MAKDPDGLLSLADLGMAGIAVKVPGGKAKGRRQRHHRAVAAVHILPKGHAGPLLPLDALDPHHPLDAANHLLPQAVHRLFNGHHPSPPFSTYSSCWGLVRNRAPSGVISTISSTQKHPSGR